MPAGPSLHLQPRQPLQARSAARYEALLDAVEAIYAEAGLDGVGIPAVARRAGMAPASVYHLFPSAEALVLGLARRYFARFAAMLEAEAAIEADRWADVYGWFVDRARQIYRDNPAVMAVLLGAGTLRAVETADRDLVRGLAERMVDLLARRFVLTPDARLVDRVEIATSLVDAVWALAYRRHGDIDDVHGAEARDAAIAYLELHIPRHLPPRTRSGSNP